MATLGLDATSYHAEANRAVGKAQSTGTAITAALTKVGAVLGVGFGIHEIGSKITERVKEIADYGEMIANLSQRLGIAVKAGQAWDIGLKVNGSNLQDQAKFFELLAVARQKALDGDKTAIRNFADLKVSVADLKKVLTVSPVPAGKDLGWVVHTPDGLWDASKGAERYVAVFGPNGVGDERTRAALSVRASGAESTIGRHQFAGGERFIRHPVQQCGDLFRSSIFP